MADVFISYFKPERSLTEALANDLAAAGFTVWWDTHLLPDDRFRTVIDAEIDACTRAIIIWTPQSIKRDWVVSEAEHAHRLGKLINTYAAGLDPVQIPKPFGQVNAVPIDDRQKIIAALSRAAKPAVKTSLPVNSVPTRQTYPVYGTGTLINTAIRLRSEAQKEGWEADPADYVIHLMTAAEEVHQAIDDFEIGVRSVELPEFSDRVWVRRVQRVVDEGLKTIKKEINWLRSHNSHGVISGARGDLQYVADQLIEACNHT